MKRDYRTLFGALLVAAGVLLGLQQFGLLQGNWGDAVFVGLWGLGALFFYDLYEQNREQWWFGLVALIFGGLAASSALDLLVPPIGRAIGGAVFLGAIGAGFILVYRREASNWWALIPAGVMFTLALITILDELPFMSGFDSGGILFIGIGLTFMALTQIPGAAGESLSWAYFPAIPLLILGGLLLLGSSTAWPFIWPVFIIGLGVYFLYQSLRRS